MTRDCYKSEDNCPAAFPFLRAARLQEDDLPVPQEIGYIKVAGKATATPDT
jgi:hypothetical protein